MPMLEYLWLLLCVLLYLKHTFNSLTEAARTQTRLSNILLDQSHMMRHKKHSRSNEFLQMEHEPKLTGDCCPSVTRVIAPLGGISKDGRLLQLFRDSRTVQKFYETECASNVRDRECSFIDGSKWVSACVQQYSYTYAIVKDFNVTEPYRIDYMMIKSGCSCTVLGPAKLPEDEVIKENLLDKLTTDLLDGR